MSSKRLGRPAKRCSIEKAEDAIITVQAVIKLIAKNESHPGTSPHSCRRCLATLWRTLTPDCYSHLFCRSRKSLWAMILLCCRAETALVHSRLILRIGKNYLPGFSQLPCRILETLVMVCCELLFNIRMFSNQLSHGAETELGEEGCLKGGHRS